MVLVIGAGRGSQAGMLGKQGAVSALLPEENKILNSNSSMRCG